MQIYFTPAPISRGFPATWRQELTEPRNVWNRAESHGLSWSTRLTKAIVVSNQDDKQQIEELRALNEQLTASIARCRMILHDCRERLAANSNEIEEADEEDDLAREG